MVTYYTYYTYTILMYYSLRGNGLNWNEFLQFQSKSKSKSFNAQFWTSLRRDGGWPTCQITTFGLVYLWWFSDQLVNLFVTWSLLSNPYKYLKPVVSWDLFLIWIQDRVPPSVLLTPKRCSPACLWWKALLITELFHVPLIVFGRSVKLWIYN